MSYTRFTTLEYSGRFRIIRKIASGGMASVYEAEQLGPVGFCKRVALKVIHPKYARQEEWLQLFIDEAKLSANLVHGNIVQIYQLGEADGTYYIAMEYIQGPTLRTVIDRHRDLGQPIPTPLAAYIASRVCRALDFAHSFVAPDGHQLDIVHRDVAPVNIMATWDGHIKLTDFGIAKAKTSADPSANGRHFVGKKHYMSPEQALSLVVEAPSDVFSLGVVLYELLTLEPLFADDITELAIDAVAIRPLPSLRALVPAIPSEIEHIVTQALDRDPARRPTAATMGRALDEWCDAQRSVPTSDRLQEHLAAIFPNTSRPARPTGAEVAEFPISDRGLRFQGRRLLRRILGM